MKQTDARDEGVDMNEQLGAQLRELKALLEDGLITDEDFKSQKDILLAAYRDDSSHGGEKNGGLSTPVRTSKSQVGVGMILIGLILAFVLLFVIGIVAAVAIPAFLRYQKRAKTSEATMNLRKLFDSQVAYYQQDHVDRRGRLLVSQFAGPSRLVPGDPTDLMCENGSSVPYLPSASDWQDPVWQALNFAMADPFLYAYEIEVSGTGADAAFTVRAIGDLDCDGVHSTYERIGTVDLDTNVIGGDALYTNMELE